MPAVGKVVRYEQDLCRLPVSVLTVIVLLGFHLGIGWALLSPQGIFGVLESSGIPVLLPLTVDALFGFGGALILVMALRTSSDLEKVVTAAGA